MLLNLGSGPHLAPEPWVNLDAHPAHHPDLVVDPLHPLVSFGGGSADKVYLGHVLEHVPWGRVPDLLAEVRRVLRVGGQVCVVGPDVYRTIREYKDGLEPWDLVVAVLEHADDDGPAGYSHQWCCHEQRLVRCLIAAKFREVEAVPVTPEALRDFPTTAHSTWQCAARGVA